MNRLEFKQDQLFARQNQFLTSNFIPRCCSLILRVKFTCKYIYFLHYDILVSKFIYLLVGYSEMFITAN